MGVNVIASLWGFAEATLFFIVPDVWLSLAGRNKLRDGLQACLYSLAGALIGGTILYLWGSNDLENASKFIEHVPAVNREMILSVRADLSEHGILAVILGPLSGTSYKLYAINAASTGLSLWLFLLISILARLIRFTLVTIFCHYALKIISKPMPTTNPVVILVTGWIIFYSYYFVLMTS